MTLDLFGMSLPVIKELGDGWYVVLHPDGPVLALGVGGDKDLYALRALPRFSVDDDDVIDYEPEGDEQPVPMRVAVEAIGAYVEWSWKICRDAGMTTK